MAPDLPGFGYTQAPPAGEFAYPFGHLASVLARFVDAVGLARFLLYVFDFGAPVGLRLAAAQPERIEALIVQNGNLSTEGLSHQTQPLPAYWRDRSGNEQAIRGLLSAETTKFQYVHGARELGARRPCLDAGHAGAGSPEPRDRHPLRGRRVGASWSCDEN